METNFPGIETETKMNAQQTVTVNGVTAEVLVKGSLRHVEDFDALTPSGAGIAGAGSAAYLSANKRRHTALWEALYEALRDRDAQLIVDVARRLPSVHVRLDTSRPLNPNYGLRVSVGGWCLFSAPVVEAPIA